MKSPKPNKIIKLRSGLNFFLSLPIFVASLLPAQEASDFATYVIFSILSALAVFGINYLLLRRSGKAVIFLILPTLFMVGTLGAMATISSMVLKITLGVVTAILFYLYESYFPDRHPAFFEEMFSLVVAFLVLVFLWGLYFFFGLAWWGLLVISGIIFALLFLQAFYKMNRRGQDLTLMTLLAVILLLEISWTQFYLPVHFLTASVVGFAVFYLIYTLSRLHFLGKLSRDKVYFQVGMIAILVALSLFSSPWGP